MQSAAAPLDVTKTRLKGHIFPQDLGPSDWSYLQACWVIPLPVQPDIRDGDGRMQRMRKQ